MGAGSNKFTLACQRSVSDQLGVLLPKCRLVICQVWGRCPEQGKQECPSDFFAHGCHHQPQPTDCWGSSRERSGAHINLLTCLGATLQSQGYPHPTKGQQPSSGTHLPAQGMVQ